MTVKINALKRMDGRRLMGLGRSVLGNERVQLAEFLKILSVIDWRRLYREEGFSSTFALCVEGYHLSKGQAYVRIAAARAGRRFPMIFEMIARGDIHMTGVAQLEKHLTPENHEELLQRAVHKTKEEVAEIVASIAPKPDVSTSIRRLPQPTKASELKGPATAGLPGLEAPPQPAAPAPLAAGKAEQAALSSSAPAATVPEPVRPQPAPRREAIEPRSPDRFSVKFTASKRCTELMQQAKDLMSHQSLNIDTGELTEMAYEVLVRELLKKKHGITDRPRQPKKQESKKQESKKQESKKQGPKKQEPKKQEPKKQEPKKQGPKKQGPKKQGPKKQGPKKQGPKKQGQQPRKKESRYIPADVKREVWARDGGRCSYVAEDGRRCSSTRLLEYDHIELKCHGGEETAENLRLRCRAHNQLSAEQALGEAHMALCAQGCLPVPKEDEEASTAVPEGLPGPAVLGRGDTRDVLR